MAGPDIAAGLQRVGGAVLSPLERIGGEEDTGNYQYVSGITGPIGPGGGGVPVNSAVPTISGTAQVGATLTGTNGTWTNTPTGFTYQWKSNGSNVGTNANTYVPVTGDIGHTITLSVVAANGSGSSTAATSAATSAVIAAGGTVARFTSRSSGFVESGSTPNFVYTDSTETFGTPPGNNIGGVLNLQFQNATAGSFKFQLHGFLTGTPGVSPQIGLGIASAGSPAGYATLPLFLYTGDGTYTALISGTAQTPINTVSAADADWLEVSRGTSGNTTVSVSHDNVTFTPIFGAALGAGVLGIQAIIDTTDDPGVGAHIDNLTASGLA